MVYKNILPQHTLFPDHHWLVFLREGYLSSLSPGDWSCAESVTTHHELVTITSATCKWAKLTQLQWLPKTPGLFEKCKPRQWTLKSFEDRPQKTEGNKAIE